MRAWDQALWLLSYCPMVSCHTLVRPRAKPLFRPDAAAEHAMAVKEGRFSRCPQGIGIGPLALTSGCLKSAPGGGGRDEGIDQQQQLTTHDPAT